MVSINDLVCKKFNVKCSAYAPHKEQYRFLIYYLGYEEVKKCIPYSLAEIKNALPNDEYLNNLRLTAWDNSAGKGSKLWSLYRRKGITSASICNGVCILKECARMWAEEG